MGSRIAAEAPGWPRILECTMPGNLTDATSLAIPWGRFPDGLPRGVQLIGPPGSERELIALAEKLGGPRTSGLRPQAGSGHA